MPARILLVEDDTQILERMAIFLRTENYWVTEASGGEEAFQLLEKEEFDLVLADIFMPRLNGFDLLRDIRSITPRVPVILMSGFDLSAKQVLKEGATDFIMKPFELDELLRKIKLALGY